MKQLVFGFLMLAGFGAFAQAAEPCIDKIIELRNEKPFSEAESQCLADSSQSASTQFSDALGGLCSADLQDLSGHFKAYLAFQEKYNGRAKDLEDARKAGVSPNRLTRILSDVNEIKTHWIVLGYKTEIDSKLTAWFSARNACVKG